MELFLAYGKTACIEVEAREEKRAIFRNTALCQELGLSICDNYN